MEKLLDLYDTGVPLYIDGVLVSARKGNSLITEQNDIINQVHEDLHITQGVKL